MRVINSNTDGLHLCEGCAHTSSLLPVNALIGNCNHSRVYIVTPGPSQPVPFKGPAQWCPCGTDTHLCPASQEVCLKLDMLHLLQKSPSPDGSYSCSCHFLGVPSLNPHSWSPPLLWLPCEGDQSPNLQSWPPAHSILVLHHPCCLPGAQPACSHSLCMVFTGDYVHPSLPFSSAQVL